MKVDLSKMIGLGVAGNFTGHLAEAGEDDGMEADNSAPAGLFPFYVPNAEGRHYGAYPYSSDTLNYPPKGENLQIEAELALICQVVYQDGLVKSITPTHAAAFNDCSIRKLDVPKLSQKKNWGPGSKGVAADWHSLKYFNERSELDSYRIVAFLERENEWIQYGLNSAVSNYSYIYEELILWTKERINNQKDNGKLEPILDLFKECNYPNEILLSVGATNYTEFGTTNFLKKGDTAIVVLYDAKLYNLKKVEEMILKDSFPQSNISYVKQEVI